MLSTNFHHLGVVDEQGFAKSPFTVLAFAEYLSHDGPREYFRAIGGETSKQFKRRLNGEQVEIELLHCRALTSWHVFAAVVWKP